MSEIFKKSHKNSHIEYCYKGSRIFKDLLTIPSKRGGSKTIILQIHNIYEDIFLIEYMYAEDYNKGE